MKIDVTSFDGQKAGSIELSDDVFGLEPRKDLIFRMIRWQLAKRRAGTHAVKNRAEIARTGKKMYKQKGTGGARHGSGRAPQFRGGGRAFGPQVRSHEHDLPKKVRQLALKHALSAKAKDGGIIVWDKAELSEPKTKVLAGGFAKSGLSSLQTYSAVDSLRIASTNFDARFTPVVVNGPLPTASTASRSLPSPRSGCAWWDLGCHLRAVTDQIVRAVIKPKPSPRAPTPVAQRYIAKSTVAVVGDRGVLPVVTRGKVASVPGAGLIGLDGATLIGLDGATLIGLDGATVISDQGGSLIGLDGATLIGLDGATLIGLDGATLIGLDGATFKPNQVALPLIGLDGAT